MIGKKTLQQKSFYGISLEQLVPWDNFYRRLDAELNLDFIYPLVKPGICQTDEYNTEPYGRTGTGHAAEFYGHETGKHKGHKRSGKGNKQLPILKIDQTSLNAFWCEMRHSF